jgi:carbon monoxide dehydrogenase subunit G
MQMTGEYRISAPPAVVWQGLNDPAILQRCIPGCESVDKVTDTEFTAKVTLQVGPVKARFAGKVTLSDLDPPNGYKISGEGQGGVAGFGKGGATVKLTPDGADTVLNYAAEAQVGGKIAQIGARLIDATAKKLADEFFSRFAEVVSQPAPAPAASAPAVTPPAAAAQPATQAVPSARSAPAAPPPAAPAQSRSALSPAIWIPALIVVVGALLWLTMG